MLSCMPLAHQHWAWCAVCLEFIHRRCFAKVTNSHTFELSPEWSWMNLGPNCLHLSLIPQWQDRPSHPFKSGCFLVVPWRLAAAVPQEQQPQWVRTLLPVRFKHIHHPASNCPLLAVISICLDMGAALLSPWHSRCNSMLPLVRLAQTHKPSLPPWEAATGMTAIFKVYPASHFSTPQSDLKSSQSRKKEVKVSVTLQSFNIRKNI